MNITKEQLSDVFVKHLERERGLQELMELMIESKLGIRSAPIRHIRVLK